MSGGVVYTGRKKELKLFPGSDQASQEIESAKSAKKLRLLEKQEQRAVFQMEKDKETHGLSVLDRLALSFNKPSWFELMLWFGTYMTDEDTRSVDDQTRAAVRHLINERVSETDSISSLTSDHANSLKESLRPNLENVMNLRYEREALSVAEHPREKRPREEPGNGFESEPGEVVEDLYDDSEEIEENVPEFLEPGNSESGLRLPQTPAKVSNSAPLRLDFAAQPARKKTKTVTANPTFDALEKLSHVLISNQRFLHDRQLLEDQHRLRPLVCAKLTKAKARKEGFKPWWVKMIAACEAFHLTELEAVFHLTHANYTEASLWEPWRGLLPAEKQIHLPTLIDNLDMFYPETKPGITEQETFRSRAQQPGEHIENYYREKVLACHKAFPHYQIDKRDLVHGKNNLPEEFKREFLNSLRIEFRKRLVKLNHSHTTRKLPEPTFEQSFSCIMDEQEKIRLEKQLEDPKKDPKKDSKKNAPGATEVCRLFAAGKCTRGAACPYKHVPPKNPKVATVNAANAQAGKTPSPSAQRVAPVRQKCTRTHADKSLGPHPAFSCTDSATYCAQCGGKGHTSYLCPTQMCTVPGCGKKHAPVCHSWDPKQVFP